MREVDDILNNYYNNYDEDSRLIKDKAHKIEYITTTTYIDNYLKKDDRILEIGAGTGRYCLHYAKEGYKVDAIELVKKNLEELKSKITEDMDIKAIQGNALNLEMYYDNTFDITLVLGPMYHLYDEDEIDQAIKEAIRVTKPKGKIFFSYITDDSVVLKYGIKSGNIRRLQDLCDENWNIPKLKEEVFATYKVSDFQKMMDRYNVNKLNDVATDGVSQILSESINSLNDEEFNSYVDYHIKNCERKDLIGYSGHVLYICEKEG